MASDSGKKWIEVKIQASPHYLEILSALIFATHAEGIREEANNFSVYYPQNKWNTEVCKLLLKELTRVIPDFDDSRMEIIFQDEQDWLKKWKENFKPFHLTEKIVIQPDWESYRPEKGEIVLTIAPKMAFGTGHHESTQLCLMLLNRWFNPRMRLLDVGTGSGILAIYAAKRGGSNIVGIDNDPVAVENAKENAALNGAADKIEFRVCDAARITDLDFDLICANISRNVLIEIAPLLTNALTDGGILIVSGVLKSDRETVEKSYIANLMIPVEVKSKNEWIAMVFKKETAEHD